MVKNERNATGQLAKLLADVAAATPSERMHRRNEVAAHGASALDAMAAWLDDPRLASFAIRTIGQIGDTDANRTTVIELLRTNRSRLAVHHQQDVDEVLARWGERATPARVRTASTARKVDLVGDAPFEPSLRARIVAAAQQRRLITYAEIGEPLELSMRNPSHRPYLTKLLDVINAHEMAEGRPPLSSIVVKKGESSPGPTFFEFGQRRGLVRDDEDERAFCTRMIEDTFEYWTGRADPEPYDATADDTAGSAVAGSTDATADGEASGASRELEGVGAR
jgi:hypothetical protein